MDIANKNVKKEQAKKRQRGQKKPKKVKPAIELEAAPASTAPQEQTRSIAVYSTVTDEQDDSVEITSLPSRNIKKSRKRKDNYDPASLGNTIVTPSAARLDAVKKATTVNQSNIVQKPIPTSSVSPRDRELMQLRRRYGTSLQIDELNHLYTIPFVPTDPDFPYELPELLLTLDIPSGYPREVASLTVKSGLEVGYARNIEREFQAEEIGYGRAGRGLLGMITWLDKNLERLLAMKKSDTVKLIRPAQMPTRTVKHDTEIMAKSVANQDSVKPQYVLPDQYTPAQLEEAKVKRAAELAKLRMIHPSQLDQDSFDLEINESFFIRLQVPATYPLNPAWLMVLRGDQLIENDANRELRESTRGLARTLNWLGANLKKLKRTIEQLPSVLVDETPEKLIEERQWRPEDDGFVPVPGHQYSVESRHDTDDEDQEDSSEDEDVQTSGSEDFADNYGTLSASDTEDAITSPHSNTPSAHAATGTAINCTLSMTGIALLEPLSTSVTLKCLRCKSSANAPLLSQSTAAASSTSGNGVDSTNQIVCTSCSAVLRCTLTSTLLLHQSNSRIGYLSLLNCTPQVLGPIKFRITCNCDKQDVIQGVVSGQQEYHICRSCHSRTSLTISNISFLNVTAPATSKLRFRATKREGQGRGLPNSGSCKHFRKSYRWFRFSCCNAVYSCPECHDSLTAPHHYAEAASAQICGYCRKEQPIRAAKPECVACASELTGKRKGASGRFWEGGKGARDQVRMARNESRKYRKKIT